MHRGVFSALGDIINVLEVVSALGDVIIPLGRYQYCIGGASLVHWEMFNALGDIISACEDIISTFGGYHRCMAGVSHYY